MGERRALRTAGRAAGELDIDGIVELQVLGKLCQFFARDIIAGLGDVTEIQHAGGLFRTQPDHAAQHGKPLGYQMTGPGFIQFGYDAAQDIDIVAGFQRRREDKRCAFDLPSTYSSSCAR